jgi:host factor-I protein
MNQNASSNPRSNNERNSHDLKLQDVFLNYCRREKVQVALHFLDQSVRHGQIIGFDSQTIILDTNGRQRLIYKTAISSIDPQDQFDYIFNEANRTEENHPPVPPSPIRYN